MTTQAPATAKSAGCNFSVTDLGRREIAYQVDQAKRWGTFSRRREMDTWPDAKVLAAEYRRIGRIMRALLKEGGRPQIESQVVGDYSRVLTALGLARAIDAGADYQKV